MRDAKPAESTTTTGPIRVEAPARLHLGFLDPDGSRGRRFGSIGLALDGIVTTIRIDPAAEFDVRGPVGEIARMRAHVDRLRAAYGLPAGGAITLEQAIPAHAGLGSGTQLALALARGLLAAHDHAFDLRAAAALLGRGRRSGIGLGIFADGGLVVDGGHGEASAQPPVIARLALPVDWRVVLIFDRAMAGLSGRAETAAFARLTPLPATQAARLCHATLLGLLPAAAEGDFATFSAAVGEVQTAIGDYFAPVQQGRYSSPRVARAAEHARTQCGLDGVGQSSWGPTAFVFCESHAAADALVTELREACAGDAALDFRICAARNRGALVTGDDRAAPRRVWTAGRA